MTGNKTRKLRGVFLAALMVFSVLAVASPASAAVTTADRTLSSTTVAPGGSVDVTLTVEFDTAHDGVAINDQLEDSAVDSIDSLSVETSGDASVGFTNVQDNTGDGTDDGVLVQVSDAAAGETITVTYTVNVASDAADGTEIDFTGVSGDDVTGGSDTADFGTDTLTVEADGGDGTPTPEPGDGMPDAADEELIDEGSYWAGQTLWSDSNLIGAGETLQVKNYDPVNDRVGSQLIDEPVANDQGEVLISTSGLDGSYALVDSPDAGGRQRIATFTVNDQQLTTSFDSGTVLNGGTDTVAELTYDSNRGQYQVVVSSGALAGDDLQALFGAGTVTAEDNLMLSISGDQTFGLDFLEMPAGQYNFTSTVVDTGVEDTASIQVNTPGAITASFADATPQEERGDVMTFTVNMQNTNSAQLEVGSESAGYHVTMDVVDGDDDGQSVTVAMNTFDAGRTGDESQVYSVVGSTTDSIRNVERTTAQLQRPLALTTGGNAYGLELSVGDEVKDVGSFFLNERSTDSMSVMRAPAAASPSELSGLLDATAEGTEVANGDWVVFEVQASGLYGYLSDKGGLAMNGLEFSIEQTNPGLNQDAVTINPVTSANARLFTDAENNSFYVAVKLVDTQVAAGQNYEATFGIDGANNPLVANAGTGLDESVSGTFSVVRAQASVDQLVDGDAIVTSSTSATVSGSTTLSPGTTVTVTVQSTSGQEPYLRRQSTEVASDGSWSVAFDTSSLPEGTPITVNVNARGESLTAGAISGEIGQPPTPEPPETRIVTRTVVQDSPTPAVETRVVTREVTREVEVEVTRTVIKTATPGQPGFGIAVAVLALLAAALLAIRRRD